MKLFKCSNCGVIFDETVAIEGEVCPICNKGRLRRIKNETT